MSVRQLLDLGSDTVAIINHSAASGYVYVTIMEPEIELLAYTRPAKSIRLGFNKTGPQLNAFIKALQGE